MGERSNSVPDESADRLSITLRIRKADDVMAIVDTEEKGASDSICKGADTFKPAFRPPGFQGRLKITFRCLGNQLIEQKNFLLHDQIMTYIISTVENDCSALDEWLLY